MPEIKRSYAGIGSRTITPLEREMITAVARDLKGLTLTCYSGNADGSDIAFQEAAAPACVTFLPWAGFNVHVFNPHKRCRETFVCGQSRIGLRSIERYHPSPKSLTIPGRMFMARNYHQIHGIKTDTVEWPRVSLVVCCADEVSGVVQGGTGQAVRIATDLGIPVINLRVDGWRDRLVTALHAMGRTTP